MNLLANASAMAAAFTMAFQPASAQLINEAEPVVENPQIDYDAFSRLTTELQSYRSKRLITLDQFNRMSTANEVVILDTRSAAAFAQGHIAGAINLPFSDFTDAKLIKALGDKDRPILIYCNNNFQDDVAPVAKKAVALALNIPTFINLYGYGYKNIFELNGTVLMSDERVNWVTASLDS